MLSRRWPTSQCWWHLEPKWLRTVSNFRAFTIRERCQVQSRQTWCGHNVFFRTRFCFIPTPIRTDVALWCVMGMMRVRVTERGFAVYQSPKTLGESTRGDPRLPHGLRARATTHRPGRPQGGDHGLLHGFKTQETTRGDRGGQWTTDSGSGHAPTGPRKL